MNKITRGKIIRIIKENIIDRYGDDYGKGITKINFKGLSEENGIVTIKELKINMDLGDEREFEAIRCMQQNVYEFGIQIETLVLVV